MALKLGDRKRHIQIFFSHWPLNGIELFNIPRESQKEYSFIHSKNIGYQVGMSWGELGEED